MSVMLGGAERCAPGSVVGTRVVLLFDSDGFSDRSWDGSVTSDVMLVQAGMIVACIFLIVSLAKR